MTATTTQRIPLSAEPELLSLKPKKRTRSEEEAVYIELTTQTNSRILLGFRGLMHLWITWVGGLEA